MWTIPNISISTNSNRRSAFNLVITALKKHQFQFQVSNLKYLPPAMLVHNDILIVGNDHQQLAYRA